MRKKASGFASKWNKKGNVITDTAMVLILIFAFIVITFFAQYIFDDLNVDIQGDEELGTEAQEMVQTQYDNFHTLFDGLFMFFFILMWCVVLVASYTVDAQPIFIIFSIILLIFVFTAAVYMGNAYEEIASDDSLSAVIPKYPMANHIMGHLLIYAICIGFSGALVMFAKNYQ